MTYTDNLRNALKKREIKLKYEFDDCSENNYDLFIKKFGIVLPEIIKQFYNQFEYLKIKEPRHFEMLSFKNMIIYDDRYLLFSIIDNDEKICFDFSNINEAGQWDIINYCNKYLITKTISSYLVNKIWAWVDKERTIWKEETYAASPDEPRL
ncbi:MAG: hypothetical protein HXX16_13690 [Bacteroidales bacterium]|nr:hypothetical protein [Bacteroidales bacterium]